MRRFAFPAACAKRFAFSARKNIGAADGAPEVYAAALKDGEVLENSSSGGVFTAFANAVLDKGGAVFGAAWSDDLTLNHICAQSREGLARLRGSKYVQSSTGDCYKQAKDILSDGRYVLYCGTPCQIAGLKAFLGRDYDNLLTADIICHGVPSMKMLRDDLKAVSGDKFSEIKDVRFRDKSKGWAVKGSITTAGGQIKYDAGTSPYYFFFLKGGIYRESCYNCRFPSENRQGDITLGDYWGVPLDLVAKMGGVNPDKGISCVLVNTQKGREWFEAVNASLNFAPSSRADAEKRISSSLPAARICRSTIPLLGGYIEKAIRLQGSV
jgi:coenzyme F420-reducing hydrogenase beta subunit